MRKMVLLALAIAMIGCAAIEYEPVMLDSSAPIDATSYRKCPPTLDVGKRCIAQIQADQWTSWTGIKVKEINETYLVTVLPDQVWFDKNRRHTPPHGEKGSLIMNLFPKRHDAPFFSLMIDVVPRDRPEGELGNGVVVDDPKQIPFKPNSVGKLVLYPNDAIGPANDPKRWYRNNFGHIWVAIERTN